ncbi:SpdD protein [Streptomyces sp. C1-2]|uniref:SpdD protein n=1 Tax=Streptomyces sp. C1-2 TaxID=2720022 RepID=UPI00143246F4|nr:SpdD protein [Streptomyces sp. C1-2]
MFTPKYPPQDTAPTPTVQTVYRPVPYAPARVPAPSAPPAHRPSVQLTTGSTLALVAVTAASVAVCAVVVRSILKGNKR